MLELPQLVVIFLLLWAALTGAPLIWAQCAHPGIQRDERVYRLAFRYAPLLLGASWLHGVVFETASWLTPRAPALFRERPAELSAIAAPGLLIAIVLVYLGISAIDRAWNRRTAAISFGLQVGAWLLLRDVPARLVDLVQSFETGSHASALQLHAAPLALAVLVPLPLITLAFLFGRQAVEPRPKSATKSPTRRLSSPYRRAPRVLARDQ